MRQLITIILMITLSAIGYSAVKSGSTITAHINDQRINSNDYMKYVGQATARVGEDNGIDIHMRYVIPFELPSIPVGEEIVSAEFSFYQTGGIAPSEELHIYGLNIDSSVSNIVIGYYDTTATLINNSVVPAGSGTLGAYQISNQALVDFVNARITAGAKAGDFIFFRFQALDNTDASIRYYEFSTANSGEESQKPTLNITTASTTPQLTKTDDVTVDEGSSYNINLSATDANVNDSLEFSIIKNTPAFVEFNNFTARTATLFIADTASIGIYSDIVIEVTDGTNTDTDTITIEIKISGSNSAPVLAAIGNHEVIEMQTSVIGFSATDVDGEPLTFSVLPASLPNFMTFTDSTNGNGSIKLEPQTNDAGVYDITVLVTDGEDTDSKIITISVISDMSDVIPIIANSDDQQVSSEGDLVFVGNGSARVGENGSDTEHSRFVIPFEMPHVPTGDIVIAATFKFNYLSSTFNAPSEALHIYGLNISRATSTVEANDYSATATLINNSVISAGSKDYGEYEISGQALIDFIQARIDDGVQAGDFIFFRFEATDNSVGSTRYYEFSTANSSVNEQRPTLTFETSSTTPRLLQTDDIVAFKDQTKEVVVVAKDMDVTDSLMFSIIKNKPTFVSLKDFTARTTTLNIANNAPLGTYSNIVIQVSDGTETNTDTITITIERFTTITNNHNGISIFIEADEGIDYVFDRNYFNPLINDVGLCYIKSDVKIKLSHNENNSYINMGNTTTIIGGDLGQIRYKVDRDWQEKYWAGDDGMYAAEGRVCYPAYTAPISFDEMEYESGVPVVGSLGFNPGFELTDRQNSYSRGLLDAAGNEYHYFTYADDDDNDPHYKNREMSASDGKSMLFCVNPKTPAIWISANNASAEYYTTPAKTYWVPKIFEQTSYMANDVNINLKNIMNANKVYYRIDGGSYVEYTTAISSNTLADGEHILEFYYNSADVQTRKIIKNPTHPSKDDVFEDGSKHGYILWKNDTEFNSWKDRMLSGGYWNTDYTAEKGRLTSLLAWKGNQGVRNPDIGRSREALMLALVPTIEGIAGNEKYFDAAKLFLLNHPRMHIEKIGHEVWQATEPGPGKELAYRGYYDDWMFYSAAFIYDLLSKEYTSDNYAGGITPIEDYRIRDMLAQNIHEELQNFGGYQVYSESHPTPDQDPDMWAVSRQTAAICAAMAMPAYNTHYYGTCGFDGTAATHKHTPYPDYAESWKDVFVTYTDKSISEHTDRLRSFPNRRTLFNWYDGILILDDGNWYDRVPYADPPEMGHGFEMFYNVMRRKFNKSYPKLDMFMERSLTGTLEGNKFTLPADHNPVGYTRQMMMNEYFPNLAPIADTVFELNADGSPRTGYYFYRVKPYGYFFYNPDWESVSITFDVESVTLNKSTASLYVDSTFQLEQTVYPAAASDKTVSWSSSNELVAKVSASGLVTAISDGTATITVTTTDGSLTAECVITVTTLTGIFSNNSSLFSKAWPNPVKVGSSLNIELSGVSSHTQSTITITDITAKPVYLASNIIVDGNGNGQMLIPIDRRFKAGIYIITINDGNSIKQMKLLIE